MLGGMVAGAVLPVFVACPRAIKLYEALCVCVCVVRGIFHADLLSTRGCRFPKGRWFFVSRAVRLSHAGRGRLVLWFLGSLVPWFLGSLVPWFLGSLVPWFRGSLVPWFPGSLVPWFLGALVSWFFGSLVPWFLGSLVSWFFGSCFCCFLFY